MSRRGNRRIERKVNQLIRKVDNAMAHLDALTAQVTKNTDVEASAVVLIQGIAKQLQDAINSGDPAQIADLQSKLSTSADTLAAAVAANTPAA